jgi:hypothetical protein
MSDLTNSVVAVCDYWKNKLDLKKEDFGISEVYYGDQVRIPKSPTICIEPDLKRAPLRAAGRQTMPDFTVYFLCYHSEVANVQQNRRNADLFAELIEDFLNSDPQMGGLVIHCWVSESTSGYSPKPGSLMRTNRLTLSANSRHQLPMS